jgi:hypothetical protein
MQVDHQTPGVAHMHSRARFGKKSVVQKKVGLGVRKERKSDDGNFGGAAAVPSANK